MSKTQFRIAEGLQEGTHYTVVKDGFDVEYPVAIASHETFMPRKSGMVYIEAVRINVNAQRSEEQGRRDDIETRSQFRNVKDKATGLYFGIPLGVNPVDKTIKWQAIPLSPRQPYDLSNPKHREEWSMISRMTNLLGSPNQAGKPLYKIIDEDQKSLSFLKIYELRKNATDIVESLDAVNRREMALNVGINADAFSEVMLRAELLQFADKNADKFLAIWGDPKRPVISVFNRAFKYGVIEHNTRGNGAGNDIGFYYNRIFLGDSEGAVINKLSEPASAQMLSSISIAATQREKQVKDGLSHKVKAEEKVINSVTATAPAVDPEKEELKKKLAEMEALLKSGAGAPINASSIDENKNPTYGGVAPLKQEPTTDLTALRAEAKELGVAKWHILGEEKLKAAIAEKKLNQTV